jgi:preprotein translocase subunit SecG
MGILSTALTVLFVIVCLLLILVILLQSDRSAGMGIIGGSSQSAFGSSTADVVTKITAVLVTLFLLGALGLAILDSYRGRKMEQNIRNSGKETAGQMIPAGNAEPATADVKE